MSVLFSAFSYILPGPSPHIEGATPCRASHQRISIPSTAGGAGCQGFFPQGRRESDALFLPWHSSDAVRRRPPRTGPPPCAYRHFHPPHRDSHRAYPQWSLHPAGSPPRIPPCLPQWRCSRPPCAPELRPGPLQSKPFPVPECGVETSSSRILFASSPAPFSYEIIPFPDFKYLFSKNAQKYGNV